MLPQLVLQICNVFPLIFCEVLLSDTHPHLVELLHPLAQLTCGASSRCCRIVKLVGQTCRQLTQCSKLLYLSCFSLVAELFFALSKNFLCLFALSDVANDAAIKSTFSCIPRVEGKFQREFFTVFSHSMQFNGFSDEVRHSCPGHPLNTFLMGVPVSFRHQYG